jgi:hypothetical protein
MQAFCKDTYSTVFPSRVYYQGKQEHYVCVHTILLLIFNYWLNLGYL